MFYAWRRRDNGPEVQLPGARIGLERLLYIFCIPIGAFALDFWMRWKINQGRPEYDGIEWVDWCYGPDLVLDGLITAAASLAEFNKSMLGPLGGVIVLLFIAFLAIMEVHKGLEPHLESNRWVLKWRARFLIAGVCNVVGLASLFVVLVLLWKN